MPVIWRGRTTTRGHETPRRLQRAVGTTAVLVTALVVAAPALAARAPSSNERAQISAAVYRSPLTSALPDSSYRVGGIRISTRGPWARARVIPRRPTVQGAVGVLRRTARRGWRLRQIGSADVGCGIAPVAVLRDLGLGCAAGQATPK
jgi:hypothetical protein